MNSAGMVNRTPDATEEDADPTVWEMFDSRMECLSPAAVNNRNMTTVSTATGIDVLMVRPAMSPKYVFAAPKRTPRKAPVITAFHVNSVGVCP
jgi:hypothetical protein